MMLKKIAKKILNDEIKEYVQEIQDLELQIGSMINVVNKKDLEQSEKLKLALEQKCKAEKENEILRKYYDLDKEPSDEVKTKIHIDLEINRLKEEKQELMLMALLCYSHIQQSYSCLPYWTYRTF